MKLSLTLAGGSLLLGRALADLPTIESKVRFNETMDSTTANQSQGSRFFYSNNGTEL